MNTFTFIPLNAHYNSCSLLYGCAIYYKIISVKTIFIQTIHHATLIDKGVLHSCIYSAIDSQFLAVDIFFLLAVNEVDIVSTCQINILIGGKFDEYCFKSNNLLDLKKRSQTRIDFACCFLEKLVTDFKNEVGKPSVKFLFFFVFTKEEV